MKFLELYKINKIILGLSFLMSIGSLCAMEKNEDRIFLYPSSVYIRNEQMMMREGEKASFRASLSATGLMKFCLDEVLFKCFARWIKR